MISFDEFKKVEITVGKILSAEKVPETDKLLKLSVDFGVIPATTAAVGAGTDASAAPIALPAEAASVQAEGAAPLRDVRQIISGIALHFPDPGALIGKRCMFVTNLEPRVIRGFESNGMLFAVSTDDGKFSLLEPSQDIPEGTIAK